MILRITLLTALLACSADAVLNSKEFKRREAPFDSYGPPSRPAPQYGPPPQHQQQHLPHREYGVPQQIPFREYGPPALKYGPPKLNFIGGGGGGGGSSNGFHNQIQTHYGVPKPFYGPPHIQHKPSPSYGPPPPKPSYGPPLPRPQAQYGPPPQQHRPASNYGPPPRPSYGPPPQSLPSTHPGPVFQPEHRPASSYGPPPSGPLTHPPSRPNFSPPQQNYGPPPLPIQLPGPQPASFNRVPETTIILTSGGGGGGGGGGHHHHHGGQFGGHGGQFGGGNGGGGGPVKQIQIQIDESGHTHSVSGSQAPFHTACDGWKPIPAPIGNYVENNHIEQQAGYSQVSHGSGGGNFGTQYNAGGVGFGGGGGGHGGGGHGGGSIIDGLTDEQLVAVALQSGSFDGPSNTIQLPAQSLPSGGPIGEFQQQHSLNSIESDALQISLADDSYVRPPSDSYAPGSVRAQQYNTVGHGHGSPHPPPQPSGPGHFGRPPTSQYGPPPGPPPPQAAAFVQHHHSGGGGGGGGGGFGIQYGSQSGNLHSFPHHGGAPPSRPVAYRPPVPQGLLESIGATVQHLDQFGVKPQNQPQTYIPPATSDIPQTGPGNVGPDYGPPPVQAPPSIIVEQQLPQPQPPQIFIQEQRGGGGGGNVHNQYGPPPQQNLGPSPIPQPPQQYLPPAQPIQPPQGNYLPPPPQGNYPPPPPQGNYLPPPQQQQGGGSYQHQENAFGSSQINQQFVHTQGLPLQQDARYNQVHDCGQGPNLVGAGYQFQQQQQQQYSSAASSGGAYNSIAQSIPVAEQHTQFISGPADSYGPPPSGNDLDHDGYASEKNSVAALPDGTDPQNLPGLDGLNVISAQKSQSIQINPDQMQNSQQTHTFQLQQIGGSAGSPLNGEQSANHDEILSQGLLQSILSAIEQPNGGAQEAGNQIQQPRINGHHAAQSRSDIDVQEDATAATEADSDAASSTKLEIKVSPDTDAEEIATVTELKPIVPIEDNADSGDDAEDNADHTLDNNDDVNDDDADADATK